LEGAGAWPNLRLAWRDLHLSQGSVYAYEAGFRPALTHYADRVPPAPQPPS